MNIIYEDWFFILIIFLSIAIYFPISLILNKCKNHLNYTEVKGEITARLSEYIYEETGRKPIILPVLTLFTIGPLYYKIRK